MKYHKIKFGAMPLVKFRWKLTLDTHSLTCLAYILLNNTICGHASACIHMQSLSNR